MCGEASGGVQDRIEPGHPGGIPRVLAMEDLLEVARAVVRQPEVRRTAAGFVGYGATKPGERVLIGVDSQTEPAITDAVAKALRELGARVDVVVAQVEDDREFDDLDEIRVAMRREPWTNNPRRWEGLPWVEELARARL